MFLCHSYIRDHVLWFFVEHLDAGEHHTTTHLLVQVSQDVVQSLSHLGVVQGHACGEHKETAHGVRESTLNHTGLNAYRDNTQTY